MTVNEAIKVLKKLHNWLDYGAGELEPTANTVMEAIDTVLSLINTGNKKGLDDSLQEKSIEVSDSQASLSNKKDRLYTAEDMQDFAEWTAFMQWIYDPTDKTWFQKHSTETKTTAQLRELWEQERRAK